MPEKLKLHSTEIKRWLENETSSTLAPVQTKAQKLLDEINSALVSLKNATKVLLDASAKEIERKNMRVYNRARALNKLARIFMDRLRKLKTSNHVAYDSLNNYTQEIQKVFTVTDLDIKKWFPRISPFFIMDRRKFLVAYEKTKLPLINLNDFIADEYVKTKTLEETFQLINELQTLEKHLSGIAKKRENLQTERMPIDKKIADLEQKITELENKGPIDQLFRIEAEAAALNNELKHKIRHLQKPFMKMQALASHGGGAGLTPDELSKLSQYMETPFKALATEETGYPVLKQILRKMSRLMAENKLKLKSDKERKAKQRLTEILQRDILANIYAKCANVAAREKQLLNSQELDQIQNNLAVFQKQIEQLRNRKFRIESNESTKEKLFNEERERIQNHKTAIEEHVFDSIGKKIKLL